MELQELYEDVMTLMNDPVGIIDEEFKHYANILTGMWESGKVYEDRETERKFCLLYEKIIGITEKWW